MHRLNAGTVQEIGAAPSVGKDLRLLGSRVLEKQAIKYMV